MKTSYCEAISQAFNFILESYDNSFVIGQGLWSPWYVGNTMKNLEKRFGKSRIIDTPVSECATTGIAIGAGTNGMIPIVVHPRMDFMMYAMDPIINQAAKWSYMFGGKAKCNVTIRGIINRGGQQGAQHSQALHSLFMHIPGLQVVMPYSPSDARDLLISSALSETPVIYIDDRWLYQTYQNLDQPKIKNLSEFTPKVIKKGKDITVVAAGYSVKLAVEASKLLQNEGIEMEIIDLRVLSSIDYKNIIKSIKKTKRLLIVDGGWSVCGLANEIIANCACKLETNTLLSPPQRITLPFSPAPCGELLEDKYFTTKEEIVKIVKFALK